MTEPAGPMTIGKLTDVLPRTRTKSAYISEYKFKDQIHAKTTDFRPRK